MLKFSQSFFEDAPKGKELMKWLSELSDFRPRHDASVGFRAAETHLLSKPKASF